jgi:hypothetical protein
VRLLGEGLAGGQRHPHGPHLPPLIADLRDRVEGDLTGINPRRVLLGVLGVCRFMIAVCRRRRSVSGLDCRQTVILQQGCLRWVATKTRLITKMTQQLTLCVLPPFSHLHSGRAAAPATEVKSRPDGPASGPMIAVSEPSAPDSGAARSQTAIMNHTDDDPSIFIPARWPAQGHTHSEQTKSAQ